MYNIFVLVRPDAEEFIKEVGKLFEVIIFTASISKYASPLLDILDKEKNIKYRLYRDHCTFINGIYIKELKKCNRNLKDLIIVDNSPIAYTFDSENGLPIKTWVEDPEDKELMKLLPILKFLSNTKDVRLFIDRFVYNNKILYDEATELIKKMELMDDDNNDFGYLDNGDKFMNNLKMLSKEEIQRDSDLNGENNYNNFDEKMNKFNIFFNNNSNSNNSNNCKSNIDLEIKNRNNELKLYLINRDSNTPNITQNTLHEKGYNTTKNVNKLFSNITFNEKDLNFKKTLNNLNDDYNIKINKISTIKPSIQKKGKKNFFRFKATERPQQENKKGFNNIVNTNKLDPSLPLTLLLSKIAKGLLTPKASYPYQEKNTKNQKKAKNTLTNIKPIYKSNKNNEKNKKKKYINLLEKYKGNNKITISLINNSNNENCCKQKKMKSNYSMKNINYSKPGNLRVSSSINNYHRFAHENRLNKYKEKNGTFYNRVTKSKSTENFLVYNHTIKHPKTPKDQHRQKISINNKNVINFFDGFSTKTTNNKNINSKENFDEKLKLRKKNLHQKII